MSKAVAVIIPAAGASTRYTISGGLRSKLDEDFGGKPLLQRTVELFTKVDVPEFTIAPILVAGPYAEEAFGEFRDRHADRLGLLGARIIRGGQTHRWETVAAGLGAIEGACDLVLIHDAARPCASPELIERVLVAAKRFGAAIPGVDVGDTLKRTMERDVAPAIDPAAAILGLASSGPVAQRFVSETVSRERMVMVQTPQVFDASLLRAAYQALLAGELRLAGGAITDDAQVVDAFVSHARGQFRLPDGWTGQVAVVPGEASNIKITRHEDLRLARAILGVKEPEGRAAHKRF
jgi:2-C-methyl-D-erythritol 4-phosphate cytidylyltransferase